MNPKYKKPFIISTVILVVIVITILILNNIVENKIKNVLKKLNSNTEINTEDISVNILTSTVEISNPWINLKGKTTGDTNLQAEFETFKIEGFGFFNYLVNENISVDKLSISNGNITLRKSPNAKGKDYKKLLSEKLKSSIEIDEIELDDIDLTIKDEDFIKDVSTIKAINLNLKSIKFNTKSEESLKYGDLKFNSKSIKHQLNNYDDLFVDALFFQNKTAELKGLKIKTKLSKTELSSAALVERDYFDIDLNDVLINAIDYGFTSSDTFYFKAKEIIIDTPNIDIYRDKLIADDTTIKPMYSEMLRELNFDLNIESVKINNGKLTYEEKVKSNTQVGKVDFKNLNASITNLGNLDSTKTVNINVNSKFMGNTSLDVVWSFNVWNTADYFRFRGHIGKMEAEQINEFATPILKVKLEGLFDKNSFTIIGNRTKAKVDMKLKYENFEVVVLKHNGNEKNKFLSGLVNLFISNDSKVDDNGYRYGHANSVERDKTKSVFNFIWLNIRAGLFSTLAGDGKRENN